MSKSGKKKVEKTNEPSSPEFDNAGELLRKLRTEKGLSTKEVSEITRISEVNLNAIENQEFESLPADTFTRGFLNIYADYLGADTPRIVSLFMEEREKSRAPVKRSLVRQPRKVLTTKVLAEPSHVSSMTMAGILLLVIIVLFTGFCLYTSWNPFSFLFKESSNIQSVMHSVFPGNKDIAEQPEYILTDPSVQDSPLIDLEETNPTTEYPIEAGQEILQENENSVEKVDQETLQENSGQQAERSKYILHVTFLKDTQVSVAIDDKPSTSEIFYTGDEKDWSADESLQLTFDQEESAAIILNGEPVEFPDLIDGIATFHLQEE